MAKCVVFDFDGTLVESNEIKRDAFYRVVESFRESRKIVDEALAFKADDDRYGILREIARRMLDERIIPPHKAVEEYADVLVKEYTQICEKLISECHEVMGATELLKKLINDKYLVFINSATPSEPLKRILKLRSIDKYFTGIYGRPGSKIENLQNIMDTANIGSNEIIFIGDNESDRFAAEVMGCHFIGILNDSSNFKFRPLRTARNLLEVKEIIFTKVIK